MILLKILLNPSCLTSSNYWTESLKMLLFAHKFSPKTCLLSQRESTETWVVLQWSWHVDVLYCTSKRFGPWSALWARSKGPPGVLNCLRWLTDVARNLLYCWCMVLSTRLLRAEWQAMAWRSLARSGALLRVMFGDMLTKVVILSVSV